MTASRHGRVWRAPLAFILSLWTPGLGYILARRFRLGYALLAVSFLAQTLAQAVMAFMAPNVEIVRVFIGLIGVFIVFALSAAVHSARLVWRDGVGSPVGWMRSTWVAAALCVLVAMGLGVMEPRWGSYSMPSGSNIPTFMVGDYVFGEKKASPRRGDMVVFDAPKNPSTSYVKRLVGLPGDRVALKDGLVVINGAPASLKALGEKIESGDKEQDTVIWRYREAFPGGAPHAIALAEGSAPSKNMSETVVPADAWFVVGDNRDSSLDSRYAEFGFVPRKNFTAVAMTIYFARDWRRILTRVE